MEQLSVNVKWTKDICEEKDDFFGACGALRGFRDISLYVSDFDDLSNWVAKMLHSLDTTVSRRTGENGRGVGVRHCSSNRSVCLLGLIARRCGQIRLGVDPTAGRHYGLYIDGGSVVRNEARKTRLEGMTSYHGMLGSAASIHMVGIWKD